jgi:hypothetical protein
MKKSTGKAWRTVAALLALGTASLPTAQTKADNVNSQNTRTIGQANKSAVKEEEKTGGQEVAKVNPFSGGLDFNDSITFNHTSPIYFPKYHPKMTWNQQRQKAKKRRKSRA